VIRAGNRCQGRLNHIQEVRLAAQHNSWSAKLTCRPKRTSKCPADAIKADTEPGLEKWLTLNAKFAAVWPNISDKKEAPVDAEEF
jgi:hypothetical protein